MKGRLIGLFAGWILLVCCSLFTPPIHPTPIPPADTAAALPSSPPADAEVQPWRPEKGISWQIQFSGEIDLTVEADLFDLDLFETDAETVAELQGRGKKVICYLNAGAWEDWRPDADRFPPEVIGRDYEGWEGEKWLDIRQLDALAPVLRARLDLCASKGFDGVDPDNIDGYTNPTGFPLTYDDQLAFNRWLSQEAHRRGLAIGLKNDPEQAADLADDFDWVLSEDCFAEGWCADFQPFLDAGKAVLAIEYTDRVQSLEPFCEQARSLGISLILKNRNLDSYRQTCL